MKRTAILKKFFGYLPGQTPTQVLALNPSERKELADLAAIELGVSVED